MKNIKKLLALLLAAIMLASMLASCTPQSPSDTEAPGESSTNPPQESTDTGDSDELLLAENGALNFTIARAFKPSDLEASAARKIRDCFASISLALPQVVAQTSIAEDYNGFIIYVGYVDDADMRAFYDELGYGEYGIKVIGKKILVAAYTYDAYEDCADLLTEIVEQNLVEKTLKLTSDKLNFVRVSSQSLNEHPKVPGCINIAYEDCQFNQTILIIKDADAEKYSKYKENFEDYTVEQSIVDNGNFFTTYSKDGDLYNVSFSKHDNAIRVIKNKDTEAPEFMAKKEVQSTVTPLMNMQGLAWGTEEYAKDYQLGLSMMFRLGTGEFIVVDGGFDRSQDAKAIYDFMVSNSPSGQKPVIAAWILTHAHPDHHNTFLKQFVGTYKSKVDIQTLIFNPPGTTINQSGEGGAYTNLITLAKGNDIEILRPHVGDKYYIGDAELDFLYTVDYRYPEDFEYYNTCSLIVSLKLGGQRIMITGDAANSAFSIIEKMYGETLKCDYVQVAHHGYTTGVDDGMATSIVEAYKHMSPTVVLYPNGESGYASTVSRVFNSILVNLPSVKEVCIAGGIANVYELPYTPK